MLREYSLVTPSLDALIHHESMEYEGLVRPPEIARIFDRPRRKVNLDNTHNRKQIEDYFHDLYGLFMKKLSGFAVMTEFEVQESVKLQAMLQECIRIKEILAGVKQIT